MTNNIIWKLTFSIFGDNFNIEEFSKLVNLKASHTHVKNEQGKFTTYKETTWDFTLTQNDNYELESLLNEMISIFQNKENEIINFKNNNNLTIKVFAVYYIYDSIVPGIYIDKKFINFLSNFDAELDCDGYSN